MTIVNLYALTSPSLMNTKPASSPTREAPAQPRRDTVQLSGEALALLQAQAERRQQD